MRTTYRIFEAGETYSLATAVTLKDGSILQVKPEQVEFETLDDWTAAVGLTEGRRLVTQEPYMPSTSFQHNVARTISKLRSEYSHTRFQPQFTRHTDQTIAAQIETLKRQIDWSLSDSRMTALKKHTDGPLAGLGMFYHYLVMYLRCFATLEAFYSHYKNMSVGWGTPPTAEEKENVDAWVKRQPAGCPTTYALEALNKLVPAEMLEPSAQRQNDEAALAALEAKVRNDPSVSHKKTSWYYLRANRVPHLFVKTSGCLLPIYYSADFAKVAIRGVNGKLYESLTAVGIQGEPEFWAMKPNTHQMWRFSPE